MVCASKWFTLGMWPHCGHFRLGSRDFMSMTCDSDVMLDPQPSDQRGIRLTFYLG
jgi:hypothetical protein